MVLLEQFLYGAPETIVVFVGLESSGFVILSIVVGLPPLARATIRSLLLSTVTSIGDGIGFPPIFISVTCGLVGSALVQQKLQLFQEHHFHLLQELLPLVPIFT